MSYSPWFRKESDRSEQGTTAPTLTASSECLGGHILGLSGRLCFSSCLSAVSFRIERPGFCREGAELGIGPFFFISVAPCNAPCLF